MSVQRQEHFNALASIRCEKCGVVTQNWVVKRGQTGLGKCRDCMGSLPSGEARRGRSPLFSNDAYLTASIKPKTCDQYEKEVLASNLQSFTTHKSASVVVFENGVQIKGVSKIGSNSIGGKRGKITEFTKASRRNQLRFMSSIPLSRFNKPVFFTVTYDGTEAWKLRGWCKNRNGERVGEYGDGWKRDLDNFGKRLKRKFSTKRMDKNGKWVSDPFIEWGWRIETQERGAPHIHFIIFPYKGFDFTEAVRTAVEWEWLDFIKPSIDLKTYQIFRTGLVTEGKQAGRWKSGNSQEYKNWVEAKRSEFPEWDVDFYRFGSNAAPVESWKHLLHYVSKYLGKPDEGQPEVEAVLGRRWGHTQGLQREAVLGIPLTENEEVLIRLVCRRWLRKQNRACNRYARRIKRGSKSFVMQDGADWILDVLDLAINGDRPEWTASKPRSNILPLSAIKKTIRWLEDRLKNKV